MATQGLYRLVPERIGTIGLVGSSALPIYKKSLNYFRNESAKENLGRLQSSEGVLTYSSPLICIQLLHSGALPSNSTLATRSALELTRDFREKHLVEASTDIGIALWTGEDNNYKPNDLVAKTLAEDLKRRSINIGNGVLIPFEVLALKEDDNSAYGVVPRIRGSAKDLILPLNSFKWDSVGDKHGARCASLWWGGWLAGYVGLGCALGTGRVVSVSGEATRKKFLKQLDNEARKQKLVA